MQCNGQTQVNDAIEKSNLPVRPNINPLNLLRKNMCMKKNEPIDRNGDDI